MGGETRREGILVIKFIAGISPPFFMKSNLSVNFEKNN